MTTPQDGTALSATPEDHESTTVPAAAALERARSDHGLARVGGMLVDVDDVPSPAEL